MKTDITVEDSGMCISHGPIDLFKLVHQIFEMSSNIKDSNTSFGLLGLCYK